MPYNPLTAITSIDGRYRDAAKEIAEYFSEFALIRARVKVECEYLIALSETKGVGMRKLTAEEKKILQEISDVSIEDAQIVKQIEKEGYEGIPATNHDVKAVEYFLKKKFEGTSLEDVSEWIHFASTSEDTNSIAYALLLRGAILDILEDALDPIRDTLDRYAKMYAAVPMLSRTHGQSASPTTFGKEMRVFYSRLARQLDELARRPILVKFSGATGNWSAHSVGAPDVDWPAFSKKFAESFNSKDVPIRLELNEFTTQIEPHDTYAEMFDSMKRVNVILTDFAQDMWRYISDGWLGQKTKSGEVGSSTMPHKVNPIDFENAEGNLGIANALFEHFSRKLPISRLQRDLSDSTVERTFGTAFAHSLVAYKALLKGLEKIEVQSEIMAEALTKHPEILAEAIQTVLRREGVAVPYEKLKELTRGRAVTLEDLDVFIDSLQISAEVKARLKTLRPEQYIGLANNIALRR